MFVVLFTMTRAVGAWFENSTLFFAEKGMEIRDCPVPNYPVHKVNGIRYILHPRWPNETDGADKDSNHLYYFCFTKTADLRREWAKCYLCTPQQISYIRRDRDFYTMLDVVALILMVFAGGLIYYYTHYIDEKMAELLKKTDPPMTMKSIEHNPIYRPRSEIDF
jgi:hypothetical protein